MFSGVLRKISLFSLIWNESLLITSFIHSFIKLYFHNLKKYTDIIWTYKDKLWRSSQKANKASKDSPQMKGDQKSVATGKRLCQSLKLDSIAKEHKKEDSDDGKLTNMETTHVQESQDGWQTSIN